MESGRPCEMLVVGSGDQVIGAGEAKGPTRRHTKSPNRDRTSREGFESDWRRWLLGQKGERGEWKDFGVEVVTWHLEF